MDGCETWTVKKAECWRIDSFELWAGEHSWESLGQQGGQTSHKLKEINPEYTLEELKLKLQSFGCLMCLLIGKGPATGKDWRQEKGTTEDEMVWCHHQLNGHEFEQILGDGEWQGSRVCCSPWGSQKVRHDWVTEQQQMAQSIILSTYTVNACWMVWKVE